MTGFKMTEQISRRDFLKKATEGLVALTASALVTPNAKAENPLSEKKYSFKQCVEAVIKVESNGNPKAMRYEKNLGEWSYGLGQLLYTTAREIEVKHPELPRLGKTRAERVESLLDGEINKQYTEAHYRDNWNFYNADPFLAVAGYNSGQFTPRNARCQEQLMDLYTVKFVKNGLFTAKKNPKARSILKQFQRENKLKSDGSLGSKSYAKLQEVWEKRFPQKSNPFAVIPQNGTTPRHVEKFRKALEEIA